MGIMDSVTQGFGNFGNALFPTDPSLGVDPAIQKAAQGRAMLQLGLGMLAGANHGIGPAAFGALQGASQDYTGAMDNAYKHTLLKRQADYQQQEHDRQAKQQQTQDRQNAASTATRVATGLSSAPDMEAYWKLVGNNPDVQAAVQASGAQVPVDQSPTSYQALAQQLGTFGQTSSAPAAARDLNLKAVLDPKTGKPVYVPETQAIGATPYDKPSAALKAIVGPDGKTAVYVPADQAVGKTPFYKADLTVSSGKLADWTPEALDFATENLYRTGKAPPGLGKGSPVLAALYAGAAAKATAEGKDSTAAIFGQQAYKAGSTALSALTKQQATIGAYEKTAEKNMDLTLQLSDKVDRTGSPIINRAIMHWRQGVTGDPDTAAFVNALTAARTEYAKVLSGATGSTGVTDSARKEADELFSKVTSPEALKLTIATAKQEMGNRMSSFDEEQARLRDSMSGPAKTAPLAAGGWSITPVQ